MEETNPWNVSNLETFHFYCCPECDQKCNTKDQFIDHAMTWHPKAHEILHFKMICDDNESVPKNFDDEVKEVKSVFPKEEPISDSESECLEVHQCDLCDIFYASKEELKIHKEGGHRCEHCNTIYTTVKEKENHMILIHSNSNQDTHLKCNYCGKYFQSKAKVQFHMKNMVLKKMNECKICSNSNAESRFSTNILCLWNLHQNSHCEPKMNQVIRICQNTILTKSTQTPHLKLTRKTTTKRWYMCDKCEKRFQSVVRLQSHKTFQHPNLVKPTNVKESAIHENVRYSCDKCDKSFSSEKYFNDHVKTIHENFRFKCDYCTKNFPSKAQVEFHMKKMNDQQTLYSCNKNDCSFIAYYLCVWNDHRMTVHHNEEVKVVLQGLSQADLINKEAWTQWKRHTNPMIDLKKLKPHLHVCDKCEKSFFTKERLKDHKIKDHKINKHTRWS